MPSFTSFWGGEVVYKVTRLQIPLTFHSWAWFGVPYMFTCSTSHWTYLWSILLDLGFRYSVQHQL